MNDDTPHTAPSEDLRAAIFDQAGVGIAVSLLDGRLVETNAKCADILGYTPDELRGRNFLDITHPDDVDDSRGAMQQLLERRVSALSFEKRYVRKDGSAVWSWTTVSVLEDADGTPLRFIGVIEDMSVRKRVETALQDEARILELLNQTGRTLGATLDLRALLQAVTDAATELSGAEFGAFFYNTTRRERRRLPALHAVRSAARGLREVRQAARHRALRPDVPWRGGHPLRRRAAGLRATDSRRRTTACRPATCRCAATSPCRSCRVSGEVHRRPVLRPLADRRVHRARRAARGRRRRAGRHRASTTRGCTKRRSTAAEERKALLESERAARSEAERMSEMKDEFLATLSHELRTPLNAIVGWAQILRTRPSDAGQLAKGLETIERNARVQAQLIEDLLDMSRITSGKLRLDIQRLHPAAVVEAAIETVRTAADAKGIRLEKILDPSAGPISGDPGRLQQVMWNLLSNAIKFTPKGGKVQVVLQRVDSHVELSVADTGMRHHARVPAARVRALPPGRRLHHAAARRPGARPVDREEPGGAARRHGDGHEPGREPGHDRHRPSAVDRRLRGRRRRWRAAGAHAAGARRLRVDGAGRSDRAGRGRSADARELIQRVLEDCAARVLTAGSAEEAVPLVESGRPDVLITDIGMPDADGYELLRRVRELGPGRGGRVPAIALTAFARSEDRTRALRAGFMVHVSKPVDPSELVATVAAVAGRVHQSGESL